MELEKGLVTVEQETSGVNLQQVSESSLKAEVTGTAPPEAPTTSHEEKCNEGPKQSKLSQKVSRIPREGEIEWNSIDVYCISAQTRPDNELLVMFCGLGSLSTMPPLIN